MKIGFVPRFLLAVLTLVFMAGRALCQERAMETIPAGTKITVHNWQQCISSLCPTV